MLFAKNISKSYSSRKESVEALDCISCSIKCGSINFVVGPSGSGKSTFLRIIGLLDKADNYFGTNYADILHAEQNASVLGRQECNHDILWGGDDALHGGRGHNRLYCVAMA